MARFVKCVFATTAISMASMQDVSAVTISMKREGNKADDLMGGAVRWGVGQINDKVLPFVEKHAKGQGEEMLGKGKDLLANGGAGVHLLLGAATGIFFKFAGLIVMGFAGMQWAIHRGCTQRGWIAGLIEDEEAIPRGDAQVSKIENTVCVFRVTGGTDAIDKEKKVIKYLPAKSAEKVEGQEADTNGMVTVTKDTELEWINAAEKWSLHSKFNDDMHKLFDADGDNNINGFDFKSRYMAFGNCMSGKEKGTAEHTAFMTGLSLTLGHALLTSPLGKMTVGKLPGFNMLA